MNKGCGKKYIHYAYFYDDDKMDEKGRGIGKPSPHNWGKMICGDWALCKTCIKQEASKK